jgi:hypothetical protein
MSKLIAIARLLLSPLLVILAACGADGNSHTQISRIANGGHDVLSSKTRVQDGVARFDCKASDSGHCHYTLYPDACAGKADCQLAPLQRFTVPRGQAREITGMRDFRVCVGIDATAMGADCKPMDAARPR